MTKAPRRTAGRFLNLLKGDDSAAALLAFPGGHYSKTLPHGGYFVALSPLQQPSPTFTGTGVTAMDALREAGAAFAKHFALDVLPVYATWVPGIIDGTFPDGVALYRAQSAAHARHLCCMAANDADFNVKFTDVRARRAKQYDRATFKNGVMPSFVELPEEAKPNE